MPGLRHFAVLIALFVGAFVPPAATEAAQPPPSSEMVALELVALEIEGLGGEIEWLDVTAEHPFWVRDEGWIEAGDLLPGDELFTSAGGWARVSGATWAEVEAAVYNLDVEGWDSYFVGEGGCWVHNAVCPQGLAARGVVDPAKFRYLFGEAGGNAHNLARTAQNAGQMARVGVYNTAEGRALLQSHFESVVTNPSNITRSFTNQYGTFQVRESLFAGPGGFVKLESTWQVLEGGGFRFTTAIPFGGP